MKRCLEGLHKGERDEAINRACYGMRENGYASYIATFLDEIVVPNEFKIKVCAGVNMPGGALKRPLQNHAQKRLVGRVLAA